MPSSMLTRKRKRTQLSSVQQRGSSVDDQGVPVKHKINEKKLDDHQPIPSLGLLDLPLELRQKIYAEYCRPTREDKVHDLTRVKSVSILHVNRQVYFEAWPIFTKYVSFKFAHPFELANNFLSFLPPPRLHSLKHLSFRHPDIPDGLLADFERTWWSYLDVFSRLETFTYEEAAEHRNYHFYQVLDTLLKLLQQGAVKRPRWVQSKTAKYRRPLPVPPADLPISHDWAVHVGSAKKLATLGSVVYNTWPPLQESRHKLVVERSNAVNRSYEHNSYDFWGAWLDQPIDLEGTTHGEAAGARAGTRFNVLERCARISGRSFTVHRDTFSGPILGPFTIPESTHFLNEPSSGGIDGFNFPTYEIMSIGGRWTNAR